MNYQPRTLRRSPLILIVTISAWFLLFQLPFAFPGHQRIASASYAYGFNNRVAIGALVLLIATLTVYRLWRSDFQAAIEFSDPGKGQLPRKALITMTCVYGAFTLSVYLWAQSVEWYGMDWESSHFLWRLKLTNLYSLRPYYDYQYEYGPILAYFPALLMKILGPAGASHEFAYYLSHYLLNVAGLYCLYHLLNSLVMQAQSKILAFIVLALAGYLPNMGLNGVLLRYLTTFMGLMILHQTLSRARGSFDVRVFMAAALGSAVNIGISAEMGVAFLLASIFYAVLSIRLHRSAIAVICAAAFSAVLSPLVLPAPYYATLLHFSQGANNLPLLVTSPHLVLYIAMLLWLIPVCLAGWRQRNSNRLLVAAMAFLCVLLIPGALGRCDPYHVLFYSLGLFALAFAHVANRHPASFRLFATAYFLIFALGLELINAWVFGVTPQAVANWMHRHNPPVVEAAALLKYPVLAMPYGSYGYTKQMQEWLWSHRRVAPEYYMGGMGIYTESQMADRLRDIGRFRYALVQDWYRNLDQYAEESCIWQWRYLRKAFLCPWRLRCKSEPLSPDGEIARYLKQNYRLVEKVGDYLVLEQVNQQLTSSGP